MPERTHPKHISSFFMSDPTSTDIPLSGVPRKFSWMPTLDGYILRSFLVPFFILLFAFTLLFIIMDMYNDVSDFLDNKAGLAVSAQYFMLKIPGNILFILPITVLLACMYALANLGRSRELTAIRASGISLGRCGLPIFIVGFCVMLLNFYFNEQLVPETSQQAEIVRKTVNNENYLEETNARLQFHSGDRLRQWYFGQFNDDGYQERVKLKFFHQRMESGKKSAASKKNDIDLWPKLVIEASKTRFVSGTDDVPGYWEFYEPFPYPYSKDAAKSETGVPAKRCTVQDILDIFKEMEINVKWDVATEKPSAPATGADATAKPDTAEETVLILSRDNRLGLGNRAKATLPQDELLKMTEFSKLVISEELAPDKPSVIIKSVVEPETLSSLDIITILHDNPHMASNLRRIYWTIFYNRLAFPWACFLCAFFAFPLATKNERSGIFTAIATAVGIAVLYQVLNEVFMVAGKSGYLPPPLAGLTPTIVFGAYGIYLLKKAG